MIGKLIRAILGGASAPRADILLSSEYRLVWNEFEGGRGFVVQRAEDLQRLKWDDLPLDLLAVNISGETFHARNLQDVGFAPGQQLALRLEPTNPYDCNAVSVWNLAGTCQAGYIPRTMAERVKANIEGGLAFRCFSMWENLRNGERVSLRILIAWGSQESRQS
jgi:hypothetical protein